MPGQYDASGVDLSLIRANMRVTPTERARRAALRVQKDWTNRPNKARLSVSALCCARVTYDVDRCYRRTSDNLERKRLREQEGLR